MSLVSIKNPVLKHVHNVEETFKMKHNIKLVTWLTIALLALFLVACGGDTASTSEDSEPVAESSTEEEPAAAQEEEAEPVAESSGTENISGTITVLTNRTDLVDNVFVDYAAQFNEIYPNVKVEFEAITDYEGEVRIRMNTEEYGDVLLIPNVIGANELPDFFVPLGTLEELDPVYTFATEQL